MTLTKFLRTYKTQFWLCVGISFFYKMSGNDPVNSYSTDMINGDKPMDFEKDHVLPIRITNALLGATRLLGAIIGGTLLDRLGRRSLYIIGGFMVTISLAVLDYGVYEDIFILI